MLLRESMLVSWADLMNAPFFPEVGMFEVRSSEFTGSNECSLRCFSWLLDFWFDINDSSKPASLFSEKRCFACHTPSHLHHFNFPLVLFEPKNLHILKSTATPWYLCSSYILAMTIYTFTGFEINVYLLTSEAKKKETLSIVSVNSGFFFFLSFTYTDVWLLELAIFVAVMESG